MSSATSNNAGRFPFPFMAYGGDYNPEQWPEEVWQDDVRLMREAGVNMVSLGIFAWAKLEPQPGQYDFGWLDRIMDLLHANGVRVDLATATASPPPWLARQHPESLPVTSAGVTLWPGSRQQYCPSSSAYRQAAQALVRRLAGRRSWLLMEQATSHVNWRPQNLAKRPGQMRLWSHQALARGSAGAMFFQWRASRAGSEKFHSAMVPHAGTESRTWREVVALGQELKRLDAVLPTRVRADVAIVFDWENWWALELDSKPTVELRLIEQVRSFYDPLFMRNITADFVPPGADLRGYRLVLVPNLYLVSDAAAQGLERYVAEGGTLIMSFFSGIVDEREHIRLGGYPAPFRRLLGLRIEDFTPYAPGQEHSISADNGVDYQCDLWSDTIRLEPQGVAVLAHARAAAR